MVTELLRALLTAFFGTLGFCVILQVPRRALLPASAVGALSYLLYWLLMRWGMSEPYAVFLGAVFGSLSGNLLARRLKMISSIYILLSIVPAVPGLGLYRFMAQLAGGQYGTAAGTGTATMITILGIALGIAAGSMIFRALLTALKRLEGERHGDRPEAG